MGRAQTAGQPHGGSPSRRVPGGSSPGGQEWAGIRISLSCHWLGAAGGKCGLSRKVVPGAVSHVSCSSSSSVATTSSKINC